MEKILRKIYQMLLEFDLTVSSPGLLYGKTGLSVFFFHYARYFGDKSCKDHAMLLTKSVLKQISHQYDIDYVNGLAGIGAGIEYLSQNALIEDNTDKILEQIDQQIFLNIAYQTDATCLTGLGRYLLLRINNPTSGDHKLGTLDNKIFLIHILDLLEQMYPQQRKDNIDCVYRFLTEVEKINIFPSKIKRLIDDIKSTGSCFHTTESYRKSVEENIYHQYKILSTCLQKKSTPDIPPQLYDGLAGIGLYLLGILDCRHKNWIQLL